MHTIASKTGTYDVKGQKKRSIRFLLGVVRGVEDETIASQIFILKIASDWLTTRVAKHGECVLYGAHLKEFVNEDAGPVDHGQVEGAPVLEKGEVGQLVVDREIVVQSIFIVGGR